MSTRARPRFGSLVATCLWRLKHTCISSWWPCEKIHTCQSLTVQPNFCRNKAAQHAVLLERTGSANCVGLFALQCCNEGHFFIWVLSVPSSLSMFYRSTTGMFLPDPSSQSSLISSTDKVISSRKPLRLRVAAHWAK